MMLFPLMYLSLLVSLLGERKENMKPFVPSRMVQNDAHKKPSYVSISFYPAVLISVSFF